MTQHIRTELERPDATIQYWSHRPALAAGPTLVLLHGATLDHHSWAPQVAALQDRFEIVTPDLRAHGESTGKFDFNAAVDDIEALLEVLPADEVVLVGLSLGGNIAQELVHRNNDKVIALVVADATCNTAVGNPMGASMAVAALRWQAATTGPAFVQHAARTMAINSRVQQYAIEANRNRSGGEVVDILASLLTKALQPDPQYRLRVPTLLLHGQLDSMGDIASGTAAWARQEVMAEHVVIPGAGHVSNLDAPEAFTEALESFLDRVLPSTVDAAGDDEAEAEDLYAREGGRSWRSLPESTRKHFRRLVAKGGDSAGRSLQKTG